tara:strand:- start:2758 stop:3024 length:267 start_codon:yes stop_codon:yes gene_type:complete
MKGKSKSQLQQDQLIKLVRWCDALGELKALESFLGEAVSHIMTENNFLKVDDSIHGLDLFCRELNRRTEVLKSDIYNECSRLRNELRG